jgi:putative ABC transport system permease protein
VAALLAALGLYGVLSHSVTQQRREIGIRMALGARSRDVLSHVLRNALSMITLGLALGLLGAFALTRVMESLLFQVSPLDPLALGVACATMISIGLLAGFVPAKRAARVDPMAVLRDEG